MIHEKEDAFYHPSIHQWLAADGDFVIEGQSFVKSPVPAGDIGYVERHERRVFERHFLLPRNRWVKLAVSVQQDNPIADVFATMGYGHTGTGEPTFMRQRTYVSRPDGRKVTAIEQDDGIQCAHGQGASSVYFSFNFETDTPSDFTRSADTTDYIPHDGNQCGGNWDYMQVTTPVGEKTLPQWRQELYAIARYGGRFVKHVANVPGADSPFVEGAPVTEADYPDAVLQSGTHFHRDTPTWIQYTHPSEPWRDKGDMRTPDDQHFSVYDAVCEVYEQHPWDEALRWEVIFAAHRFLFQIPGRDKGTYNWDPGQARAMGRIPKFAAKAVRALMAAGEPDLAVDVGRRSAERLNNQVKEFRDNVIAGRPPWPNFEGSGKHSPAEIGIWWWGLDAAQVMFAEHGISFLEPELRYMKNAISRFCFDSYFWKDGRLELPYYVTTDWTHPRIPSGGRHFAWLAARNAIPQGAAEEKKMEALIAMGESIPERFKG